MDIALASTDDISDDDILISEQLDIIKSAKSLEISQILQINLSSLIMLLIQVLNLIPIFVLNKLNGDQTYIDKLNYSFHFVINIICIEIIGVILSNTLLLKYLEKKHNINKLYICQILLFGFYLAGCLLVPNPFDMTSIYYMFGHFCFICYIGFLCLWLSYGDIIDVDKKN
jgi:H+/gluconate symporter-like permease